MPKARKGFRFNPQVYEDFSDLASKNGYTVTAALEKFMGDAVKFGLVFPSSRMQPRKPRAGSCWLGLKRSITFLILGSYAFSLRSSGAPGCSPTFMVFTFVNPRKHPPVILIDTATR